MYNIWKATWIVASECENRWIRQYWLENEENCQQTNLLRFGFEREKSRERECKYYWHKMETRRTAKYIYACDVEEKSRPWRKNIWSRHDKKKCFRKEWVSEELALCLPWSTNDVTRQRSTEWVHFLTDSISVRKINTHHDDRFRRFCKRLIKAVFSFQNRDWRPIAWSEVKRQREVLFCSILWLIYCPSSQNPIDLINGGN